MNEMSAISPPVSRYLSRAAWAGNVTAVYSWLQKGLKVEEVADGRTPVLWALSGGHEDAARVLITKGADLTKKTAAGDNALVCAVWGENPKLVRLMLEKGIDPEEKGQGGRTALDWAHQFGNADIIKALDDALVPRRRATAQQLLQQQARRNKIKIAP